MTLVQEIDDMVAELNERGEPWDIHQTHDKRWVVTIGSHLDPRYRTVNEPTIALALAAAVASKALPVVPRRPMVYVRSRFEITKSGSGWRLLYDGTFVTATRTKGGAESTADRFVNRSGIEAAAWDELYLRLTTNGTEGVDFHWEK